jgi:hypothetical protein
MTSSKVLVHPAVDTCSPLRVTGYECHSGHHPQPSGREALRGHFRN